MTTSNPTTDDQRRVYRGGSWRRSSATIVRAAFRIVNTPTFRDIYLGFRTAQSGCRQVLKVQP